MLTEILGILGILVPVILWLIDRYCPKSPQKPSPTPGGDKDSDDDSQHDAA